MEGQEELLFVSLDSSTCVAVLAIFFKGAQAIGELNLKLAKLLLPVF